MLFFPVSAPARVSLKQLLIFGLMFSLCYKYISGASILESYFRLFSYMKYFWSTCRTQVYIYLKGASPGRADVCRGILAGP